MGGEFKKVPIYDYYCESCDKTFEVSQKFTDEPIKICKFCSGTVRKLLSAPAIVFKGTGWYVTDYPSSDRKKGMEAEKKRAEKKSEPSSSKAAGKPASCAGVCN